MRSGDADLQVNHEVLFSTLKQVLSSPRHHQTHPEVRDAVGSYLYGRFGREGLITYMQTFTAERPYMGGLDESKVIKTIQPKLNSGRNLSLSAGLGAS